MFGKASKINCRLLRANHIRNYFHKNWISKYLDFFRNKAPMFLSSPLSLMTGKLKGFPAIQFVEQFLKRSPKIL